MTPQRRRSDSKISKAIKALPPLVLLLLLSKDDLLAAVRAYLTPPSFSKKGLPCSSRTPDVVRGENRDELVDSQDSQPVMDIFSFQKK